MKLEISDFLPDEDLSLTLEEQFRVETFTLATRQLSLQECQSLLVQLFNQIVVQQRGTESLLTLLLQQMEIENDSVGKTGHGEISSVRNGQLD